MQSTKLHDDLSRVSAELTVTATAKATLEAKLSETSERLREAAENNARLVKDISALREANRCVAIGRARVWLLGPCHAVLPFDSALPAAARWRRVTTRKTRS